MPYLAPWKRTSTECKAHSLLSLVTYVQIQHLTLTLWLYGWASYLTSLWTLFSSSAKNILYLWNCGKNCRWVRSWPGAPSGWPVAENNVVWRQTVVWQWWQTENNVVWWHSSLSGYVQSYMDSARESQREGGSCFSAHGIGQNIKKNSLLGILFKPNEKMLECLNMLQFPGTWVV